MRNTDVFFKSIVDEAYKNPTPRSLNELGDLLRSNAQLDRADYIYELAKGKTKAPSGLYANSTGTSLITKKRKQYNLLKNIELKHLEQVRTSIKKKINEIRSYMKSLSREDLAYMDDDQKSDWVYFYKSNKKDEENISEYEGISNNPYYAKMDTLNYDNKKAFYIGEKDYDKENSDNKIYSAWSQIGQDYRSGKTIVEINGNKCEVLEKKKISIKDNSIELYDEYNRENIKQVSGDISDEDIDPFLYNVLMQKRGEKNISNIIRSIQSNQNDIIEFDFNKSFFVEGCAGSGKTMILFHRLANMKYNLPDMDLGKIKIITPNRYFNLYVDELSKNLELEKIKKTTIIDYYIDLLQRYRNQNKKRVKKEKEEDKEKEILTGKGLSSEQQRICSEESIAAEIRKKIYSKEVAQKINTIAEENPSGKDYGEALNCYYLAIQNLGLDNNDMQKNCKCTLYARLLFLFMYYGPVFFGTKDNLICVDEGQDLHAYDYGLIKRINGNSVEFNIYGDPNQQTENDVSINTVKLKNEFQLELFELKENYRNSKEIVAYYNEKLGFKDTSLGVSTKEVEEIEFKDLATLIKLQLIFGNRVAIIHKGEFNLHNELNSLCSVEKMEPNKATVLNVKQAKGLEFDAVFAIQDGMNRNEKYITQTRALSELYIVH